VLSAANLAPLLWVPCAMAGLLSIPTRAHREGRLRAVLDASIVSTALILTFWLLFLEPLYANSALSQLEKVVVLSYPVLDLVLAVTAFVVAAQTRAGLRRFLHLVTCGFLLIAVSDGLSAVRLAAAQDGLDWGSVVRQLGISAFLWAASVATVSERSDDSASVALTDAALPHLPVAAGFAVWTWQLSVQTRLDADVMVVTLMVAGLLVRQLLYARSTALTSHRLSIESRHDALTGLMNRRACMGGLADWLAEAPEGQVAVVLLDLDGFKEVNDDFGHAVGDQALVDFAGALRDGRRDDGVPGRLGGDEFALIVTGQDAEGRAAAAAARLVRGRPTRIGAATLTIGASAGVATSRAGDSSSALLRRADLALYEAKRRRVRAWSSSRRASPPARSGGTSSHRGCRGQPPGESCRWSTSRCSASRTARPSVSRRCCAGSTPSSARCRRGSSSRSPRRRAPSGTSAVGCSTGRRPTSRPGPARG
jgi:diguanylate cyclase (GGDEF)-like protein